MKYTIEFQSGDEKVRIETDSAESAHRFIDALEKISRDFVLAQADLSFLQEQAG